MSDPQDALVAHNRDVWRLAQLALVSQVATQVTSIMDLDELLVRVTGLIYQTFEFYVISLYTLEKDRLVLRAQAGPEGKFSVDDAFIPAEKTEVVLGEGIIGWVAEHQQELVATDVSRDRRFRYSPEFPRTRAEATLPLKVEDTLLGVLDVQLDYPEDFDESDMLVLRALAGQVSMAIEDTRLYAEAKRRGDYLATIAEVSWAVASILDVDELLAEVSELIHKYFGYPFVQLFTINYGRRQIVYRAGSGLRAEALKQKKVHLYNLDAEQGIIPLVARTGEAVLADDVTLFPTYRPAEIMPTATKSELTIPLLYNDEVLGILDVQSDEVGAFSPEDQTTMETLASNIAVALRNASLYQSERWRHQVAESLRRISGVLIAEVNLANVLDSILDELKRSLPSEILAIWLIRNKKLQLSTVRTVTGCEFTPAFDPELDPWLAKGLAEAEPLLLRQSGDPPDPIAYQCGYGPGHSAIVAPLRVQNRLLGLLTLAHSQNRQYGQEAMLVTTAFANQAAIAIENARLFQVAQEEALITSALLKVAQAAQGFDPLSEVLAAVTQIPPLLAEVDRCAIWLSDDNDEILEPEAAYGFSPAAQAFFEGYAIDRAKVLAAERLNQVRAPIVIVKATEDPRLPPELVAGLELHTLVLLPLVAHDDMLGLMLVTFTTPAVIREEALRMITGVARQVAVAIESKYLYERKAEQERMTRELELAHGIQARLIPAHLPAPPGWEIAAFWQSAQEVTGDFYDVIEVAPHQLGIVMADVAGKGMPAALYMALTRSLLRATAPGLTNPQAVLTRINELLLPDSQRGMFISLFYAVLNTETGLLTYANAGHNPPLYLSPGRVEALRTRGIVLGVQPAIEPEVGTCQLQPGEGVVFYTDGVTEVSDSAGNIFGEANLKQLLLTHWDRGPEPLIDQVRQAVNAFSATALPTDDFTLLVLRRTVDGRR